MANGTAQATRPRYIIPSLGKMYERFGDLAWPLFRISYGLFFIPHGMQKLFGAWGYNAAPTIAAFDKAGISPKNSRPPI